jgi:hypothetical protein
MTSALRSVGALLSMGTTERMFPKRQMYACRRDQAGPSPAPGRHQPVVASVRSPLGSGHP